MPNRINAFWLGLAVAAFGNAQASVWLHQAPVDVKPGSITWQNCMPRIR